MRPINRTYTFSKEFDEYLFDHKDEILASQSVEFNVKVQSNINVPKCPTCNSTDVKKISTMSKVAGATMFGLFSKTARSQFKCENCGYKW